MTYKLEISPVNSIFFEPHIINFSTYRLLSSKGVWVDKNFYAMDDVYSLKKFETQFSYAIDENECFEKFKFDKTDCKTYQAERYGGAGVVCHGGGVRCGNYNGFQIKGIGKNPLAGDTKEKWHSYGGLHAKDAVYELIYAQVLDKVLPLGVARIHGVIFTTYNGAYKTYNDADGQFTKDWGALLIRDICLRPGHFIRSPRYKPSRNNSIRISSDVARVKSINKVFRESFSSVNDLIMYLGKFLQNCANQFAFARIARIMHTGICPSNLCFDGRWIDLTNTSFIGSGENIGGRPPFYEEPFAVIEIMREFADTFSKYNNIDLNIAPLINYYGEQLSSYFNYHLAFLFAIEYAHLEETIIGNEYKALAEQTGALINSGKMVVTQWPEEIKVMDPVLVLLKGLFISLFDVSEAATNFNLISHIKNFNSHTTMENFKRIIFSTYSNSNNKNISYGNYVMAVAITALKRTIFPEYFYKIRLDKQIELVLSINAIDGSRELIDDSIAISQWVFSSNENDCVYLYKSRVTVIYFNKLEGIFCFVEVDASVEQRFEQVSELIVAVENAEDNLFIIQNYQFKRHIVDILSIVENLQTCCAEFI